MGFDESWVTVKLEGRSSKLAPFCACQRVEPKEVGEVERDPASGSADAQGGLPSSTLCKKGGDEMSPLDGRGEAGETSNGLPIP